MTRAPSTPSASSSPSPRQHRASELDARFGDPWDAGNPLGFQALLAADERAELAPAGEAMLDEFGLGAEFVPTELGGRLASLEELIEVMRALFRRDPCLGLGHGASSLIAAVNVWVGGREDQRRVVADRLLAGGKLACGYYELAHGNDLARVDLRAQLEGERLHLDGGKQAISNLARCDAMVLFARTSAAAGGRSHSQILLERAALPAAGFTPGPRFPTTGMRGVQLGGIELHDCVVPASCVLGVPGRGLEVALTSFQLTRVALPGMFMGILDSGLRTALRYALGRTLYGGRVAELPLTRAVLTDAFVDLLICDCVTTVVARALHVLPREASVTTAAAKYLVPRLLIDAMNRLASVLGASFYVREGEHAIFQKLLRDLAPASFGHLSGVAALLSLLPQLPGLARRAWANQEAAPAEVFTFDAALPALPWDRLALSSGGHDHISSSLAAAQAALAGASDVTEPEHRELRARVARLVAHLDELKHACHALAPHELGPEAPAEHYDLAARYAVLLAASACVNTWLHNPAWGRFQRGPAWLLAALARLCARLEGAPAPVLADEVVTRLYDELLRRYQAGTSFDLASRALPGWQRAQSTSAVRSS